MLRRRFRTRGCGEPLYQEFADQTKSLGRGTMLTMRSSITPIRASSRTGRQKLHLTDTMERKTKSYPVPWQGRLVLACRKCQRKLKSEHGLKALGNVKKSVKARNKRQ